MSGRLQSFSVLRKAACTILWGSGPLLHFLKVSLTLNKVCNDNTLKERYWQNLDHSKEVVLFAVLKSSNLSYPTIDNDILLLI